MSKGRALSRGRVGARGFEASAGSVARLGGFDATVPDPVLLGSVRSSSRWPCCSRSRSSYASLTRPPSSSVATLAGMAGSALIVLRTAARRPEETMAPMALSSSQSSASAGSCNLGPLTASLDPAGSGSAESCAATLAVETAPPSCSRSVTGFASSSFKRRVKVSRRCDAEAPLKATASPASSAPKPSSIRRAGGSGGTSSSHTDRRRWLETPTATVRLRARPRPAQLAGSLSTNWSSSSQRSVGTRACARAAGFVRRRPSVPRCGGCGRRSNAAERVGPAITDPLPVQPTRARARPPGIAPTASRPGHSLPTPTTRAPGPSAPLLRARVAPATSVPHLS